jgi:hypothetical protein
LSGGALVVAAPVLFVAALMNPALSQPDAVLCPLWTPVHLAIWMGSALNVFGLVGLYLRQTEETGLLGLVAFVVLFFGYVITAVAPAVEAVALPAIAAVHDGPSTVEALLFDAEGLLGTLTVVVAVSFGMTSVGYILTGIAIIRARVLPQASGALLISGPLASLVYLVVPSALSVASVVYVGTVEAALFWLGAMLLGEKGAPPETRLPGKGAA